MTFLSARTLYRRAEQAVAAPVVNPHEIIRVTLKELSHSLNVLTQAQAQALSYPPEHINRALTAIYILQSSLDFEKGGELATNLFRVYEFCRLRTMEAFRREPAAELPAAAQHIASLLEAWESISPAGN